MYLLLCPFSFPSQFLEGLYCSAWYPGSLPVKSSKSILISSPSFYFLLHLFSWMPDFCIQLSTCHQNTHFKLNMPKTLHTHMLLHLSDGNSVLSIAQAKNLVDSALDFTGPHSVHQHSLLAVPSQHHLSSTSPTTWLSSCPFPPGYYSSLLTLTLAVLHTPTSILSAAGLSLSVPNIV